MHLFPKFFGRHSTTICVPQRLPLAGCADPVCPASPYCITVCCVGRVKRPADWVLVMLVKDITWFKDSRMPGSICRVFVWFGLLFPKTRPALSQSQAEASYLDILVAWPVPEGKQSFHPVCSVSSVLPGSYMSGVHLRHPKEKLNERSKHLANW